MKVPADFWKQVVAVADSIDDFNRRNGRDPDDYEMKAIVATAKDLAACSTTGVH